MINKHSIQNIEQLEAVIGEREERIKVKILPALDSVMKEFISRSPLAFVSTTDEDGYVDVSPKGDPPGFVLVDNNGCLLIPERPGNKLAYGFRNILRNGGIGLLFLLPNQRETLRVKGVATLHKDPDVLEKMTVNGKPALMYTRVEVKECSIHCGKALIRSKLWKPETWDEGTKSLAVTQFASILRDGSEEAYQTTKDNLEDIYKKELY